MNCALRRVVVTRIEEYVVKVLPRSLQSRHEIDHFDVILEQLQEKALSIGDENAIVRCKIRKHVGMDLLFVRQRDDDQINAAFSKLPVERL